MKHKKFWDLNQAQNYLGNNIIMVGGLPVFVLEVSSSGRRSGLAISYVECAAASTNNRSQSIDIMDKDVDLNPVPLGMTSYFNGAEWETFFLSRKPARMWKVGLHRTNLAVQYPDPTAKSHMADPVRNLLPSKYLADTVLGVYHTFTEAKSLLRKHKGALPLSRRFCFNSKGELFYETVGVPIGKIDKLDISLDKDYLFLSEALQEDIK